MAITFKDVEKMIEKTAGKIDVSDIGRLGAIVGLPAMAGELAGKGTALATAPSDLEVKKLQAEYVKQQMEKTLADLETRNKFEKAKEALIGSSKSTLRI